jgi:hypothetical protein
VKIRMRDTEKKSTALEPSTPGLFQPPFLPTHPDNPRPSCDPVTRKYACDHPECDKSFYHTTSLSRHKKIHRNERLFCCDFCDGKYQERQILKRHMLRKHGTETLMGKSVTEETVMAHLDFKYPQKYPRERVKTAVLLPSASNNEFSHQTESAHLMEISPLPFDMAIPQLPVHETETELMTLENCTLPSTPFPFLPEQGQTFNDPEFCLENILPPCSPLDLGQLEGLSDSLSTFPATPQLSLTDSAGTLRNTRSNNDSPLESNQTNKNQTGKFKCVVPKCNKSFKKNYSLNRHFKIHRNEKGPFCCDFCGSKHIEKFNLKRHMLLKHGTETLMGKPVTQETVTAYLDSKYPKKLVKNEKGPFCCDFCGSKYIEKSNLKRHMLGRQHETETLMGKPVTQETVTAYLDSKYPKKLVKTAVLPPSASNNELSYQTEPAHLKEISQPVITGKTGNLPCDMGTPQLPALSSLTATPPRVVPGFGSQEIKSSPAPISTAPVSRNRPSPLGHPHDSQNLSITKTIQNIRNVLSMLPLIPPSDPKIVELQISTTTTTIRTLFMLLFSKLPLGLSPQESQSQISMMTELVRNMITMVLTSSSDSRKSQICSTLDVVKNLLSEMVPGMSNQPIKQEIIDLTPSDPEVHVDSIPDGNSDSRSIPVLFSGSSTPQRLTGQVAAPPQTNNSQKTVDPDQRSSLNAFSLFASDKSPRAEQQTGNDLSMG